MLQRILTFSRSKINQGVHNSVFYYVWYVVYGSNRIYLSFFRSTAATAGAGAMWLLKLAKFKSI